MASAVALRLNETEQAAEDLCVSIPAGFRLEGGGTLEDAVLRFRLTGTPGAPLVVTAGGISADRFVETAPDGRPGWWGDLVRRGGGVDLDRFQVLAFDYLPLAPTAAVAITTGDQARLLALALDSLGADRISAFVGGSYGGMVGLAFAATYPERLERLVVLGAAHRPHPMGTAWRGVQRRIIALAAAAGRPEDGVALARELAMTTYRSPEEFAGRFESAAPAEVGGAHPVCEYLIACGRKYPAKMSAERLISLSDSVDRHRIAPEAVLAPTTVIAFDTDRLTPPEDARELASRLPRLDGFHLLPTLFGHDAFLKEAAALTPILQTALADAAAPANA